MPLGKKKRRHSQVKRTNSKGFLGDLRPQMRDKAEVISPKRFETHRSVDTKKLCVACGFHATHSGSVSSPALHEAAAAVATRTSTTHARWSNPESSGATRAVSDLGQRRCQSGLVDDWTDETRGHFCTCAAEASISHFDLTTSGLLHMCS